MSSREAPESADAPALGALGEDYQIIGELAGGGRPGARTYLATQRGSGAPVLIAAARSPEGDAGNALSHLAADVNLLAGQTHRNLLGVRDGKWLDTGTFAVVTDRPQMPTLDDLIERRDEAFDFARIAMILQQVNSLLEWARERRVVHRLVMPSTLFVEPGSDRVVASFAAGPLPRTGMPGADTDARTIAQLARTMLTRSSAAPEREQQPLAELRPGMPESLIAETEGLLQSTDAERGPADVSAYIARIAMAEALKQGEVHLAEARAAIEEERRKHREQVESERRAHEEQIAAERRQHEEEIAEERKAHARAVEEQAASFARTREDFERDLGMEHKALHKERETLARERAAHETDRKKFLADREAQQQALRAVQERLEWEAAAVSTQAELYARTAEYETPVSVPAIPELPAVDDGPFDADRGAARAMAPERDGSAGQAAASRAPRRRWSGWAWMRSRQTPLTVAAALMVIAIIAIALTRHRAAAGTQFATPVSAVRIVDSVGGGVDSLGVAGASAGGVDSLGVESSGSGASVPADLLSGVSERAASQPAPVRSSQPEEVPAPEPRRSYFGPPASPQPEAVPAPATPAMDTTFVAPRSMPLRRTDSVSRPRPDSIVPRPVTGLPVRDTILRPRTDSVARPPLIPATDTQPIRDTTGVTGG